MFDSLGINKKKINFVDTASNQLHLVAETFYFPSFSCFHVSIYNMIFLPNESHRASLRLVKKNFGHLF